MANQGTLVGFEFSSLVFTGTAATEITAGANGPLDAGIIGDTFTITPSPTYAVTIDDDDTTLDDGYIDGTGLQTIIGAGTTLPGANDGDTVEVEYTITVEPVGGGDPITLYSVAIGPSGYNGNPTLIWLTDAPLDPAVTYVITATADGPSVPYSSLVCFTSGTLIKTPTGPKAVEDLEEGDFVTTLNSGAQRIRWIGSTTRVGKGKFAPIVFTAGSIGNKTELSVSPQHKILMEGWQCELLFGEKEILVPAKSLVNGDTIYRRESDEITYWHFMFDQHEIVFSNDVPSESFFPGSEAMSALDKATQEEIFELFPELSSNFENYGKLAKPSVSFKEGKSLLRSLS